MYTSNVPSSALQVRKFSQNKSVNEDNVHVTQPIPVTSAADQSEYGESQLVKFPSSLSFIIQHSAELKNADATISKSEQEWAVESLYQLACFSQSQQKELQNKIEECAELEEFNNNLEEACEKETQNYDKLKKTTDIANEKKDKNISNLKNENTQLKIENEKLKDKIPEKGSASSHQSKPPLPPSSKTLTLSRNKNNIPENRDITSYQKRNTANTSSSAPVLKRHASFEVPHSSAALPGSSDVFNAAQAENYALSNQKAQRPSSAGSPRSSFVRKRHSMSGLNDSWQMVDSLGSSTLSLPEDMETAYLRRELREESAVDKSVNHSRVTLVGADIPTLKNALQDKDKYLRLEAVRELAKQKILHEDVINALMIAALQDDYEHVRFDAILALSGKKPLPDHALEAFIFALKDKSKSVRSIAATEIMEYKKLPRQAIDTLLLYLKHEDKEIRFSAARILSRHIALSPQGNQILIDALKDKDKEVRFLSALTLSRHIALYSVGIQVLMDDFLQDENEHTRFLAAYTLCGQRILSEDIIQALIFALQDTNKEVREVVASKLMLQKNKQQNAISSLLRDFQLTCKAMSSEAAQVVAHFKFRAD